MSGCIVGNEGEPITLATVRLVRARKGHVCEECRDPISVGDLYETMKGRCDGEWWSHKTCARCVNVRTDYFAQWTYGMLVEDFEAEHGVDYRDGIPAHITPCREAS